VNSVSIDAAARTIPLQSYISSLCDREHVPCAGTDRRRRGSGSSTDRNGRGLTERGRNDPRRPVVRLRGGGTPADEAGSASIDRVNESIEDLRELPDSTDLASEAFREAGIETDVHDVVGDPADAILELADEFDADAIVVGARRRSPVGKVVFGSVAQTVILDTDRPVTVAPA
jgi:nucleotide-binding universal stress UspA family protein